MRDACSHFWGKTASLQLQTLLAFIHTALECERKHEMRSYPLTLIGKEAFKWAVALSLAWGYATYAQEQFVSAHAGGTCLTNSSGTAAIQGCIKGAGSQNIQMRWVAAENVFYGPLKVSGQCLEAKGQGQALAFTACRTGPAQEWKLTGSTGQLNNGQGMCADLPNQTRQVGSPIIAWPCHGGGNQKWLNGNYSRIKVFAVPNMRAVPTGTKLSVVNNNIVAGGAGNIVAAGAGNIVAGGAGNIVAGGAGNIVAGGAGN